MSSAPTPEWSLQIQHQLKENLAQIQSRIDSACLKAGRSPDEVKLVAVTKYTPVEIVSQLLHLQQTELGENRPQQLIERSELLSDQFSWHLIGQLQRNKVRSVLPDTSLIHSVDSLRLLQHIDRIAQELEIRPQVLLQVNISEEESKSGFSESQINESWPEIAQYSNLDIVGLMTMAPFTSDETVIRGTFRGLRELRDVLNESGKHSPLTELSMGMSNDFEIAIEEGATYIRLGSSIFTGCEAEE